MRKSVLTLLLPILPMTAGAQVYADFQTSRGNFTCELNEDIVPVTVANFVTLAEGTRPWLDERNGTVVQRQPFYDGVTFHRVVDRGDFRLIQAGSRKGDGSDGPGYSFADEFDAATPASYDHDEPYLLSMANTGLDGNGSQFFITGTANASFNGKHTVFGKVVSGRAVVDAILGVQTDGNDRPLEPVQIRHVSIRRVGAEAEEFTGLEEDLPEVSAPSFRTETKDHGVSLVFNQPAQSLVRVWTSVNGGTTWEDAGHRYIGPDERPAGAVRLDVPDSSQPVQFRVGMTTYPPEALVPGSLANTQLYIANESGEYLFRFDPAGASTWLIVLPSGEIKTGMIKQFTYEPDGYAATVTVDAGDNGTWRYRLAPTAKSRSGNLTGINAGSFYNYLFGWISYEENLEFSLSPLER